MPKNPCKQAALYLLRRFTSSTPRKLMTNSMAGLLTYSGNRGLPNRHNQWLSVFSEPLLFFKILFSSMRIIFNEYVHNIR